MPTSEASITGGVFHSQSCAGDCKWQMNKRIKIKTEMRPHWEWKKKIIRVLDYGRESIRVPAD